MKNRRVTAEVETQKTIEDMTRKYALGELSSRDKRKLDKLMMKDNKARRLGIKEITFNKADQISKDQMKFLDALSNTYKQKDQIERARMRDISESMQQGFMKKVSHDKEIAKGIKSSMKEKERLARSMNLGIKENMQEKRRLAEEMNENISRGLFEKRRLTEDISRDMKAYMGEKQEHSEKITKQMMDWLNKRILHDLSKMREDQRDEYFGNEANLKKYFDEMMSRFKK